MKLMLQYPELTASSLNKGLLLILYVVFLKTNYKHINSGFIFAHRCTKMFVLSRSCIVLVKTFSLVLIAIGNKLLCLIMTQFKIYLSIDRSIDRSIYKLHKKIEIFSPYHLLHFSTCSTHFPITFKNVLIFLCHVKYRNILLKYFGSSTRDPNFLTDMS